MGMQGYGARGTGSTPCHRSIWQRAANPTEQGGFPTILALSDALKWASVPVVRRLQMSEHRATIRWNRQTPGFDYKSYNREHTWTFPKSGSTVAATAAPAYKGKPEFVDPEEAFVASIASCHMLTFLAVAAMRKFTLDSYDDEASGVLERNNEGRLAITRVTLRPKIVFSGSNRPDADTIVRMHHESHEQCFIANSVTTQIDVTPVDLVQHV